MQIMPRQRLQNQRNDKQMQRISSERVSEALIFKQIDPLQ